jgi:predicted nucleic acid-binding Zn ribbon protein
MGVAIRTLRWQQHRTHLGSRQNRLELRREFRVAVQQDIAHRLQKLTRRRDELERDLIAASPAFKAEKQRARRGLKEIAAALPDNAVLIDFVEYVPVRTEAWALKITDLKPPTPPEGPQTTM